MINADAIRWALGICLLGEGDDGVVTSDEEERAFKILMEVREDESWDIK